VKHDFNPNGLKSHRGSPWVSILSWLNLKANKDYFSYEYIHLYKDKHKYEYICMWYMYIYIYIYSTSLTCLNWAGRTVQDSLSCIDELPSSLFGTCSSPRMPMCMSVEVAVECCSRELHWYAGPHPLLLSSSLCKYPTKYLNITTSRYLAFLFPGEKIVLLNIFLRSNKLIVVVIEELPWLPLGPCCFLPVYIKIILELLFAVAGIFW